MFPAQEGRGQVGFNPPATHCWGLFMARGALCLPVLHLLRQLSWEIPKLRLRGWEGLV